VILDGVNFFINEAQVKDYINKSHLKKGESEAILDIRKTIETYLSGKKISVFKEIKALDVDLAISEKFPTEFMQKVIKIVSNLDHGETISYSGIGEKINSNAFQAIGNILAKNPLPLIVPCHRVIKKSGEFGGFMGKTEETWQKALKKALINLEQPNSTTMSLNKFI